MLSPLFGGGLGGDRVCTSTKRTRPSELESVSAAEQIQATEAMTAGTRRSKASTSKPVNKIDEEYDLAESGSIHWDCHRARLLRNIVVDAVSFATKQICWLRHLGWNLQALTALGVLVAVHVPSTKTPFPNEKAYKTPRVCSTFKCVSKHAWVVRGPYRALNQQV